MSSARTTSSTIDSAVPLAITTTFTAPPQCAETNGGLTMLKNDGFRIWLNHPLPVPGTTITSCYAPEFASSFLLQRGGVSQAAMSPVVCPEGYTTQGPFTSNYIACCPRGWDGFAPAKNPPSDRPAFGGTCFSNIFGSTIRITSYDDSSLKASSLFTATNSQDQVFAYPYEGFALGAAIVASTTPPAQGQPTSPSSSTRTGTGQISINTEPVNGAGGLFEQGSSDRSGSRSTAGVVAGAVIGSILGSLALAGIIFFALAYRRKRLSTHSLNPSTNYPSYGAHIRLNNDSPTPMMYMDLKETGSRVGAAHELPVGGFAQGTGMAGELADRPLLRYEMDGGSKAPSVAVKSLPDLPPSSR